MWSQRQKPSEKAEVKAAVMAVEEFWQRGGEKKRKPSIHRALPPVPSLDELKAVAMAAGNPTDQALLVFAYLTAGRVNEIVRRVAKRDIAFTTIHGREFMLVTMPNEKHREVKEKVLPIPVDKEGDLVSVVLQYIVPLGDDAVLFPFSDVTAWKKIKRLAGFHPHFLRHIRATYLVRLYHFTEQELVRFMGWSDGRPAKYYVWLDSHDLARRM